MAETPPADLPLAKRAVYRGWVTPQQLEAAVETARQTLGTRLLSLTADQIRSLEGPPARPVPAEAAEAMKDPANKVGRYWKTGHLGTGGMATVFRAWDEELQRWVALKFLKRVGDDSARAGERERGTQELRKRLTEKPPEDEWIVTMARFLLGELSEADFLKVAKDSKDRRCEAYFYPGGRRMADGDVEGAKALFKSCVAEGLRSFSEHVAAWAELGR